MLFPSVKAQLQTKRLCQKANYAVNHQGACINILKSCLTLHVNSLGINLRMMTLDHIYSCFTRIFPSPIELLVKYGSRFQYVLHPNFTFHPIFHSNLSFYYPIVQLSATSSNTQNLKTRTTLETEINNQK